MALIEDALQLDTGKAPHAGGVSEIFSVAGWTVEMLSSPQSIKAEWHALEVECSLPNANYAWAEAWYGNVAAAQHQKIRIVMGRDPAGDPAYILPLIEERRGPFSVLLWPGGTHFAYNSGLFSKACRKQIKRHGADAFWKHVFSHIEGVDALAAYGLPGIDSEADNPLAALPHIDASCKSFCFELSPDWPALYESKTSSQRRREDRRCERRLAEYGEVRFVVAEGQADRLRLMNVLLEQKSAQLRTGGAPDFPNQAGVREFYERLITSPHWKEDTQTYIAALEVDGDPVATNFGLIKDGTFHGLIMAMTDGELARFAPGRQALKRTVERHCNNGLKKIDLGAGEESNKLKWADTPVARRDVIVALSLRGHLFTAGLRLFFAAKTKIKTTPALWRLFSRYRKHLGC